MKKGFFKAPPPSFFLLVTLLSLPSCAGFLELTNRDSEDPAEFDRGYDPDSAEGEEPDTETITGNDEDDGGAANELEYSQRRVKRAIAARDVVLGMTRKQVADSWGRPTQREVAGKSGGGHERWTYGSKFSLTEPRTVIFENGRVAGWGQ